MNSSGIHRPQLCCRRSEKSECNTGEIDIVPQEGEPQEEEPQEEEPQEEAGPQNPRYLESIRVVTTLFAAILGFGLNHILEAEHTEPARSVIAHHRWGFFLIALFIFLRFLTGSANHLWLEYVKDPRVDRPRFGLNPDDILFTVDLAWLTLFGCLGVAMCYAKNEDTFFLLTSGLLTAALIWSLLDWFFRRRQWRLEIGNWGPTWIVLNLIHLFVVLAAWLAGYLGTISLVAKGDGALGLLGYWLTTLFMDRALGVRLAIVGFVSAALLAYDFYRQLRQLAKPPPAQVLSNTPLDREVNVSADIHPTATFSKDMDSSTINPSTFKLLDQATLQQVPPSVPDGVHYDEPTKVATFTPAADLQNGRTYEATITSGVKDKAGNTLAQDHVWHFTVS
jgi:hypothetical protein